MEGKKPESVNDQVFLLFIEAPCKSGRMCLPVSRGEVSIL